MDTVELFWNRDNTRRAVGYEIRRNGNFIGFTDGVSYIDASLQADEQHTYDVVAVSREGEMLGFSSIVVQAGELQCN